MSETSASAPQNKELSEWLREMEWNESERESWWKTTFITSHSYADESYQINYFASRCLERWEMNV